MKVSERTYQVVCISGSRSWPKNKAQVIYDQIDKLAPGTFVIHGDCPTGVDKLADEYARGRGLCVFAYPADWKTHGLAAGPIRNREMLDLHPDRVLAFHPYLTKSKGTKDCVEEAERRGIPVEVIVG